MRVTFTSLLLALIISFAGCDNADTSTGTMRVLLTDAPGDFLSAVVTIDQVYLQSGGSDEDPESGRTILRSDPVTVDLLTLQNEVLELVEGQSVSAGHYNQLRLVISGGYIEVEDDDAGSIIYASSDDYAAQQGVIAEGRLQMPSYSSSGLKITLPNELASIEGDQNIVLLDFNVAETFGREAGNNDMWVMHPVVHASALAFTGSVEITLGFAPDVTLPQGLTLADFSAELDKEGDLLSISFSDLDGEGIYSVHYLYLRPGLFIVDLEAPEGLTITTDQELPLNVSVESGIESVVDVVITSVEEV